MVFDQDTTEAKNAMEQALDQVARVEDTLGTVQEDANNAQDTAGKVTFYPQQPSAPLLLFLVPSTLGSPSAVPCPLNPRLPFCCSMSLQAPDLSCSPAPAPPRAALCFSSTALHHFSTTLSLSLVALALSLSLVALSLSLSPHHVCTRLPDIAAFLKGIGRS